MCNIFANNVYGLAVSVIYVLPVSNRLIQNVLRLVIAMADSKNVDLAVLFNGCFN